MRRESHFSSAHSIIRPVRAQNNSRFVQNFKKKFKGNVKKKYSENQKQWNSKTLGKQYVSVFDVVTNLIF